MPIKLVFSQAAELSIHFKVNQYVITFAPPNETRIRMHKRGEKKRLKNPDSSKVHTQAPLIMMHALYHCANTDNIAPKNGLDMANKSIFLRLIPR